MVDTMKLRAAFPDTTVFKDTNIVAIFKAASIPSFLRDWILKRKAESDGRIHDAEDLRKYIYEIIPRRENLLELKDAARSEGRTKKFLAKIEIQFNVRSDEYTFAIPELGLGHAETLIEDYLWNRIKDDVVKTAGGWGLVQLGYRSPDDENPRGCFTLLEYKNFCPYTIDLDAYREARSQFTAEEWIDIVLGAIDYNPEGYEDWIQKHTLLTRLLPFVEPRLNLVELAPKGTGKSYLFGQVGKIRLAGQRWDTDTGEDVRRHQWEEPRPDCVERLCGAGRNPIDQLPRPERDAGRAESLHGKWRNHGRQEPYHWGGRCHPAREHPANRNGRNQRYVPKTAGSVSRVGVAGSVPWFYSGARHPPHE